MKSAKRDQQNMIKRKEMIENRKEYYENLNTEKERAELQEREKTRREAEKAETKRRDEEEKRRTEERSAREEKHKDKLLKMEKVKKLMEQVFVSVTSFVTVLFEKKLLESPNPTPEPYKSYSTKVQHVIMSHHVNTSARREAVRRTH